MVNKVNVYNKQKKIGECEFYTNEFGEFVAYEGDNVQIHDEWEQTEKQGIIQILDMHIKEIPINKEIFNKILNIRFEMGYQSGRWSENEYLQDEIANAEFEYITQICDNENFQYKIDWENIKATANDYDEETISIKDIIEYNINQNNYWQFDTLACDIENQLIDYLTKQL